MSVHTAAQFFAGFEEMAAIAPGDLKDEDFLRVMVKHVPKATAADFEKYLAAWQAQKEAEADEYLAEAETARLDLELFQGLPKGTSFRDAVAAKAAEGHPRALAYLAEWNDPRHHARMALLDAAVDAHPAWRREGGVYVQDPDIEGPSDDVGLVDWFQRTHPRNAAAIEARFSQSAA